MVKLEKREEKIYTTTTYNATFIKKAKNLQGKWDGEHWVFDEKVESLLREVLKDIYGTDGEGYTRKVIVEIDIDRYDDIDGQDLKIGDLVIITRRTRDSEVTLKEGVIVISGGFPSKGGSVKNPRLSAYKGTVIRVEIPETLYAKIAECQGVSLVQDNTDLEAELIKIEEEIKKLNQKKMEILKKLGRD